jgi:hypothetical protein
VIARLPPAALFLVLAAIIVLALVSVFFPRRG